MGNPSEYSHVRTFSFSKASLMVLFELTTGLDSSFRGVSAIVSAKGGRGEAPERRRAKMYDFSRGNFWRVEERGIGVTDKKKL